MVGVHSSNLPNGNVLMWDGQSWGPDARIWNPTTSTATSVRAPSNIFCGAQEQMSDGRIITVGGHLGAHQGMRDVNIFDPVANSWRGVADMANPRWYPGLSEHGRDRLLGWIERALAAERLDPRSADGVAG